MQLMAMDMHVGYSVSDDMIYIAIIKRNLIQSGSVSTVCACADFPTFGETGFYTKNIYSTMATA